VEDSWIRVCPIPKTHLQRGYTPNEYHTPTIRHNLQQQRAPDAIRLYYGCALQPRLWAKFRLVNAHGHPTLIHATRYASSLVSSCSLLSMQAGSSVDQGSFVQSCESAKIAATHHRQHMGIPYTNTTMIPVLRNFCRAPIPCSTRFA